jgi:pyruvate kinase
MEKNIAVVHPRMDNDEISQLISKGIAGALFSISHQNYALAAKLIRQVKELSAKHNRPVSIIQDVSEMQDPMDLEFGLRTGVNWVAADKEEYLQKAKKINKHAGLIFKGRGLPKKFRVDSVMADSFLDPDAHVKELGNLQVKHLTTPHTNQDIIDMLMNMAGHVDAPVVALSDLAVARALSWRRPKHKIIFTSKDNHQVAKSALFWGVHPMYEKNDIYSFIKNRQLAKNGQRFVDGRNIKHVSISSI